MSEDEDPEAQAARAIALVIMGVSGSGKSTVGEKLAERLGWTLAEGDRLHPPENVEKMRQGVPLTDEDRAPWLDRIGELLRTWASERRSGLVTCSALKRAYRERLLTARPDLRFVYLKGCAALLAARVKGRRHEYMPASLLQSQFDTLEEPLPGEPVITIDAGETPEAEVNAIIAALGR
jgi:carbohydrate kinase (thermoresistant glucokinase family)